MQDFTNPLMSTLYRTKKAQSKQYRTQIWQQMLAIVVWRSLLDYYDVISVLAIRPRLAFLFIKVVTDLPILYRFITMCPYSFGYNL